MEWGLPAYVYTTIHVRVMHEMRCEGCGREWKMQDASARCDAGMLYRDEKDNVRNDMDMQNIRNIVTCVGGGRIMVVNPFMRSSHF